MHNHFILKSLAAVKPGGYVAVLTSSFTMDAANPTSRREISAMRMVETLLAFSSEPATAALAAGAAVD